MKCFKDTTVAGKVIHQTIKISSGRHHDRRKPKGQVTTESVRKNNERLAIRNLALLLDNNFDETGSHITLTYKEAVSKEQAKKDRGKFIRDLRKALAKNGIDLKYVAVTEYKNKRIHHHIVVNTNDQTLIRKLWKNGFTRATVLDESGDYLQLAEYLVKETEKTFREQDSVHKQRYSPSRNLVRPVTKREEVSLDTLDDDPHPIPGYYIPKDRVRRFEHPVTGIEHLEYYMIAIGKPRKYKRWPRGHVIPASEKMCRVPVDVEAQFDLWESIYEGSWEE